MSLKPLSIEQFRAFQDALKKNVQSASQYFKGLKSLYSAFEINEQELVQLEFGAELIAVEQEYETLKTACAAEHQSLKNRYKLIDDRILAVEQKLYLGIPDDLNEMDKLIFEQESIVSDQETLNEAEGVLLEKMSRIDVDYGKRLAKLDQSRLNRNLPLQSKSDAFQHQLSQQEKQIGFKSKLFVLIPVLLIWIVLDFLFQKLFSQDLSLSKGHSMLNHFVFLIGFILTEWFVTDQLKAKVSTGMAKKICDGFVHELEQSLAENERKVKQIEQRLSLSRNDILKVLEDA